MRNFGKSLIRFVSAEDGPTTVEYAALILLLILGALTAITMYGQSTARISSPPLPAEVQPFE